MRGNFKPFVFRKQGVKMKKLKLLVPIVAIWL
jgi:hypothetical protein